MLSGAALSIGITLTIVDFVIKADRGQQWEKVKSLTYEAIMSNLMGIALFLPSCFGSERMILDYEFIFLDAIGDGIVTDGNVVSDTIIKMAKAMENKVEPRDIEDGWDRVFLSKWQIPLEKSTIKELQTNYAFLKSHIQEMRIILIPRVLRLSEDQEVNAALLRFEKYASLFESQLLRNGLEKKEILLDAETIISLLEVIGNLYEIMKRKYSNYA
jgi:hypothetical protein